FLQGLTARFVAQGLGITSDQACGVVIVGSNPLSRLLARLFQDRNEPVVIIETDEAACRLAEEQKIHTFLSSAFDEVVLEAAGVATTGTFLAMTSNGEVNLGVALRVVEEFDPRRVLAIFPRDPQANTPAANSKSSSKKIAQAFAPELVLKSWNTYLNDGSVKLGQTRLRSLGFEFQKAHLNALIRSQELVPLLLEREESVEIMAVEDEWKPGDLIIYLLHDPKPALLKRLSGAKQPLRIAERVAAVEEVPIPLPLDLPKIPKVEMAKGDSAKGDSEKSKSESKVQKAKATEGAPPEIVESSEPRLS
ncbi:MAG: NAD-binding protein, partial [Prochlorotrichaceae cyanobacterium]